jgi:gas vesicle protein
LDLFPSYVVVVVVVGAVVGAVVAVVVALKFIPSTTIVLNSV